MLKFAGLALLYLTTRNAFINAVLFNNRLVVAMVGNQQNGCVLLLIYFATNDGNCSRLWLFLK